LCGQSRVKDEPSILGVVDLNRHGRIVAADFSLSAREHVVALPSGFGEPTPLERAVRPARDVAGRLRRGARRQGK
jgi:hypothetical protein